MHTVRLFLREMARFDNAEVFVEPGMDTQNLPDAAK